MYSAGAPTASASLSLLASWMPQWAVEVGTPTLLPSVTPRQGGDSLSTMAIGTLQGEKEKQFQLQTVLAKVMYTHPQVLAKLLFRHRDNSNDYDRMV